MRFTKLYIPKELYSNGIADIEMDRLGQIVVLVGKNGSGKSRILEKLQSFSALYKDLDKDDLEREENAIESHRDNYNRNKENFERLEKLYPKSSFHNKEETLQRILKDLTLAEKSLSAMLISHLSKPSFGGRRSINFIPKITSMSDPIGESFGDLQSSSLRLTIGNLTQLPKIVLPVIQSIQNRYYEVKREDFDGAKEEVNKAIDEYQNLKHWIREFLGVELKRDKYGNACLFDFRIGDAKLSDGQAILLQLCVTLYQTGKDLNNYIISIDEPENHIHPSAIIETLSRIIEVTKESQIWIATHSLPIIAYLASVQETSIYYVEEGKVSFAGSTPEKVLKGLLGDEEQVSKLHDFIGLPAQYAINQYAYQCLFEPAVAETGANDPQTNQIKNILDDLAKGKSFKILDYGAGKGRLLANILETDTELLKKTDYVAYDTFTTYKTQCEGVINTAYGDDTSKRYFSSMTDLKSIHKNSFDVVLLCNVLHEIPPQDWIELFSNDIDNLLNENGEVLIVEDSQIPIGEKAHQHGFIVFDEAQIRELFCIGGGQDFISQAHPKNQRLKAHLVPKKYLSNITTETREAAIKSLNNKAKEEIRKLRALSPESIGFKQGREHAFWVQQFANTQLAFDAK